MKNTLPPAGSDHISSMGVRRLRTIPTFCLTALVALVVLLHAPGQAFALDENGNRLVRVGVYENRPIVFADGDGRYSGIAIDVLKAAAQKEGWRLEFVPRTWADLLTLLENREIDLLVGIAINEERGKRFQFTRQNLIGNWGIVYKNPKSRITSPLDLEGLRVALPHGSIHAEAFEKILHEFNVSYLPVYSESFTGVLQLLHEGRADAGVVNRLVGILHTGAYNIIPTGIAFNPVYIHYAAPKTADSALIKTLDSHLEALKADKSSIYYQSLDRWLSASEPRSFPGWPKYALGSLMGVLALSLLVSLLLRHQVKSKTSELMTANKMLLNEVAEHELAEIALRKSEEQFRRYFELGQIGMAITAPDKKWLHVNKRLCAILGYSREELLRTTWDALTHPEDLEADVSQFNRLLAGAIEGYTMDKRFIRQNGEEVCTALSVAAVRRDDRAVEHIITHVQDVTDRKQAEQALQKSEERYRDLFENASDAIFLVDTGLNYIDSNKKAEELFGFTKEEFRQMKILDLIPPEQAERSRTELQKLKSNGVYEKFEGKQRTKDGRWLDIEVSSSAIIEDGKIMGSRDIVRDISGRKRLEEDLRQAQKMEAIGTLAGGIAHDFNNILYAIQGYAELSLIDAPKESAIHGNLQEITKAAQRAADLVRQILTFSRKNEQQRKPVQLQPVVKEALHLLRGTLPATIKIQQDIDPDCGSILADLTQVHQVIINLCTNAYQAMREQGGILKIGLTEVKTDHESAALLKDLPPGRYARLTVGDTGHGMDSQTLKRIFEPYFTTRKQRDGTGLGLATVHGIVTSHEGVVTVRSTPGQGTAFDVYFPIHARDPESAREQPTHSALPTIRCHVLYVDDEESIARLGKRILEKLGCEVTTLTGSIEALEAFRADPHRFDVVVTDQTMPDMTGADLADKLLAIRPDLPIILATGFSDTINEQEARALGIRKFIMKPLTIHDLTQAVYEALNLRSEAATGS